MSVLLGQPRQHRHQRLAAVLVDHAGDLVGDEQRRLPRQRRRHGQALQLTARQSAGVAFGQTVEADLGEQLRDVGGLARRQSPDDVVGNAGAEHLTLRVLHDHGGTAEPAQPHGARPLDGARGRFASRQHQHQRRLARAVGPGHREMLARLDGHRHRTERIVVVLRITETDVLQSRRDRGDPPRVGRRLQLVHVRYAQQPGHHPRQRPPADQADHDDGQHRRRRRTDTASSPARWRSQA